MKKLLPIVLIWLICVTTGCTECIEIYLFDGHYGCMEVHLNDICSKCMEVHISMIICLNVNLVLNVLWHNNK